VVGTLLLRCASHEVQCLAQQIQKLPFDLGEAFYLNSVKSLHARSLGFAGFVVILKARLFGKLEQD
jgi:inner membrane protein involved in colicin E2 resistance